MVVMDESKIWIMVVSYCKFGGLGLCLQLNKELISSMFILVG